jgi:hypothetical protein
MDTFHAATLEVNYIYEDDGIGGFREKVAYLVWYGYEPSERMFVVRAWCEANRVDIECVRGRWVMTCFTGAGRFIRIVADTITLSHTEFDVERKDVQRFGDQFRWAIR